MRIMFEQNTKDIKQNKEQKQQKMNKNSVDTSIIGRITKIEQNSKRKRNRNSKVKDRKNHIFDFLENRNGRRNRFKLGTNRNMCDNIMDLHNL